MAIPQSFNSKECEWADMEVFIGGNAVNKIKGIRYKRSQVKEQLHGAGNKSLGVQRGNKSVNGSLMLLKGAVDDLNAAAVALGEESILDVDFDVVVSYMPKGSRKIKVDTVVGVSITEYEKGWDQGATSMPITLPFEAVDVVEKP